MAFDVRTSGMPVINDGNSVATPTVLPEFGAPDTLEALRDKVLELWNRMSVVAALYQQTEYRYPERQFWEVLEALNIFNMTHGGTLPTERKDGTPLQAGDMHGDYSQAGIPLRPLIYNGETWVSYLLDIQPGGSMIDALLASMGLSGDVINAPNAALVDALRTELRAGVSADLDTFAEVKAALDALSAEVDALSLNNAVLTGTPTAPTAPPGTDTTQVATTAFVKVAADAAAAASVPLTQKGSAGGVASLDGGGKVPSAQLPSYVDDVIEAANFAALPGSGEAGKIYVTLDNGKAFRWSGSAYIEIVASPGSTDALAEGSTNKYFTDGRAQAALASALSGKLDTSLKGANSGLAELDSGGKVPSAQLPAPALVNMPFEGERSLEYFGIATSESALNLPRLEEAIALGKPLCAEPGKLYPWEGRIVTPSGGLRLKGNGAILKPFYTAASGDTAGTRYAIRSNVASFGTTYGVSYTAGTRVAEVDATPSDLAVGDTFGLFSDTYNGRWPICYRTITAISGTTLTFDKAIVWDMRMNQAFDPADPTNSAGLTGVVTGRKIPFGGQLALTDCVFDLSGIVDGTGEADGFLRMLSYDSVELERLILKGLDINPASTDYLLNADYCREVRLKSLRAPNARKNGSFISASRAAMFVAEDIQWSGRGFGLAPVNCDNFFISDIVAAGDQGNPIGGPDVSVRAIRPIGCLRGFIGTAQITDYDSGVKLEDCANIITMGLETERVRTSWSVSSQNPGWRDGGHHLNGFNFKDYRAYGINIGGSGTGGGKVRACMISNGSIETSDAGASEAIIQWGSIAHVNNVAIPQWPSGKAPFATVTVDGVLSRGTLSNFDANAKITSGRLGIKIISTHVDFLVDPHTVRCNAPGGLFNEAPQLVKQKFLPLEYTVYSNHVKASHTGDTNETAIRSITIPGGAMGPNGYVELEVAFSWTSSANNKVFRIRNGSMAGGAPMSSTVTTNASRTWRGRIRNRNSQSSQINPANLASGVGDGSSAHVLTTVDTSTDWTIYITGTLANTGEEVAVESVTAKVCYVP
ncbi:hypothetical protein [Hyphomonas sp.]|uniref:hypothetical protein n=1 Tax=Hyphomonas sp. TaxID=87 RepID=UPI0025C50789|nr:hypothetical protein [Hyphomonas sp.]MBI1401464.1 hypothetical protein [Hyphomonas sp.]